MPCFTSGSGLAPDLARGLHHQFQLAPLIVDRKQIARRHRGKAALRAQSQIFDGHILGRFIDAAPSSSCDSSPASLVVTSPSTTVLFRGIMRSGRSFRRAPNRIPAGTSTYQAEELLGNRS